MSAETTPVPDLVDNVQVYNPRIDRIREALLGADCAFEDEIAKALNCSRRQVQRLGLPFAKHGETRIYNLAGSRDVILRRMQPPDR